MIDLEDGTYTAVVDSIEDGLATVFFEADGEDVASATLDADVLPAEDRHEDAIYTVDVEAGEVTQWEYDAEETTERAEAAQDRFDRLSSRPPKDDE
jgi:hypothetical protein